MASTLVTACGYTGASYKGYVPPALHGAKVCSVTTQTCYSTWAIISVIGPSQGSRVVVDAGDCVL